MTLSSQVRAGPGGRDGWMLRVLVIGGCAGVLGVRLWLLPGIALWCDEAWTLMIVTQPDWRGFGRELWLDPNAPLYYLLLRLWTQVAGAGDVALRVPSLLCAVATGLLPLVRRPPGLSRAAGATWGALLFCWMPGILFSVEARCYALLLLLATAQAIGFAGLLTMPRPTRAAAALWCGLAAAAMLTHYLAVFAVAAQGAVYLARHRAAAVRTWPALAAFVPVAGWGVYHLPRLRHFSAPEVAWYDPVTWATAWRPIAFTVGPMTPLFPAMVLAITGVAAWTARGRRGAGDTALAWVAGAGAIALLLTILAGAARPMLSPRYLTPVVPSILLGLVLIVRGVARPRIGFALLLAPFLATGLKAGALADFIAEQGRFGWQDGSDAIAGAHPDRLVFAADSPSSGGGDPRSMAQVGAVFLTRAGQRPAVVSLLLAGRGDPHPHLIAATAGAARPAILWFYDRQRGMAARFPPAIAARYPGWTCRHRSSEASGVMACVRQVEGAYRGATPD